MGEDDRFPGFRRLHPGLYSITPKGFKRPRRVQRNPAGVIRIKPRVESSEPGEALCNVDERITLVDSHASAPLSGRREESRRRAPGRSAPALALHPGAACGVYQSRLPAGGARGRPSRPGDDGPRQRPGALDPQQEDDGPGQDLPGGSAPVRADLRRQPERDERGRPVARILRRRLDRHQHGLSGSQGGARRRRLGDDV